MHTKIWHLGFGFIASFTFVAIPARGADFYLSPDPTYGVGGIKALNPTTIDLNRIPTQLIPLADGKLIVVSNEVSTGKASVLRLMPDGTRDVTFGENGAGFSYFSDGSQEN